MWEERGEEKQKREHERLSFAILRQMETHEQLSKIFFRANNAARRIIIKQYEILHKLEVLRAEYKNI